METRVIWDFGTEYAREPVLRRMPDGSLVCLFLAGGPREPDNENVVMVTRSYDDGDSWDAPSTLFEHSRRGVWATELFTGGDLPFIVLCTYNAENHYRELQTFRSFTYDSGRTWTEPASFPCGLNGVSLRQGIVLESGAWVFPLYWQETDYDFDWTRNTQAEHGGAERFPFRTGVAISWDRGETFSRHGVLRGERGLWEPNCVEAEPDHLLMFMRDKASAFLVRSDSFDGGLSWSEPVTTGIANPNTKVTLLKVGRDILLINNFGEGRGMEKRTRLEIRISRDGGRMFGEPFPLEAPDARFFYPHAFADDARQTLYVAYENMYLHRLARIPYGELGLSTPK